MRRLSIVAWMAATLLAACGGGSQTITGTGGGPPPVTPPPGATGPTVSAVTVTTSSPSILSDGSTTATITALARDASNNLIAGVPVTFSATSGGVAVTASTTSTAGAATATLSTAGDSSLRSITVTAKASGKTATVAVQVVSGATSSTVQMGSPAGTGFKASIIGISSTSLSAGGSASLTVALQQSDGTLYTQPATVTFSSNCAAQNLAKITSPVSTSTGVATATYVASGCSGSDLITATATVGTNSLSASGTVTVAAASIGSIVYKSATYTIISLKGSGTTAHPETSTVVFQVLDQSGAPSSGASVSFALSTSVGGISVTPGPVTSDANGNVQTTVQAGTVATPVRVTATVLNTTPTISTQSNQLSVSTGVPTQNAFSIAVTCHNVEAYNTDGVTVAVTARLADRFSNPVADGTAVQFNSEGGHILPQCTTTTTATESGVCSVNWVSADPRPTVGSGGRKGRSTIFATAIGEESFVDSNGNGAFDPGETFTDLAERFRDDNGDGIYQPTEYFYDFNNNGVRDPADGIFNGVLCNDPARCDSSKTSTGIAASNLIIMSGSTPAGISPSPGTLASMTAAASTKTYAFTVADVNGNPMAAGTSIKASVSGKGFALTAGFPNTYTYPCTTEPIDYSFSLSSDGTGTVGETVTILLDITSAGGIETFVTYTFTAT
jgi:hypothetical protein